MNSSKKKTKQEKHRQSDNKEKIHFSWLTQKNSIVIIAVLSFFVFIPALSAGFVNLDDPQYLTENPFVKALNFINIKSFFTSSF